MKKKYTYLIIIFLIVASCIAFGRVAGNDFINFDDTELITKNYHIQSGFNTESILWAVSTTHLSYWHPLTWLSITLDWSLFGANASGHHLVSLILHIGVVIFLFLFLYKTTNNLWSSAFAAAFFALHPLRVESVAWASERKDVLSMFFGMATIYAYAFYAEKTKISWYFLCLILFVLSLMSKPMMVTLPFVLMLLDYWPLKRWQKVLDKPATRFNLAGKLVCEKFPFIFLTLAISIVTLWAQNKEGATSLEDNLPFVVGGANAIVSYVAYLEKNFWPANLAVFYPYRLSLSLWRVLISGIVITSITLVVLYYIRKFSFLFVGWFWYIGTLVPVIGLVQAGSQAMADRYTYLPSIGIAIILAWGIPNWFKNEYIHEKILFPTAIAVLCILTFLTWMQCGYWKNSTTLFSCALQVTKNNYLAHNNLGVAMNAEGKIKESINHYNKSISINPNYIFAYINRGNLYNNLGRYQLAINDYNQAIQRKSDYATAYYERGLAYFNLGQYQRAIEDNNEAIRLKPDFAEAYNNRGNAYLHLDNKQQGCDDAQKACTLGSCYALEFAKSKGNCF